MEQSSFSATSRRTADKNLRTILLAGVGGSLVFHLTAIAGVAHLWKPVAAIDEPMDITMVDVDPEKPPEQPKPKPTPVAAIVKTPVKVEPKPEAAKPVSIVKVPAKLEPEPKPAPAKPVPIVKTAAALDDLIDSAKPTLRERTPAKPVSKPAPKSIAPQPKAVTPPAFADELFKAAQPPAKTPEPPKQKVAKSPPVIAPEPEAPSSNNQSGLAPKSPTPKLATRATDTPTPVQDQDFGQVAPSKINPPTEEISPSNSNQSGLAGNPTNTSKLPGRLAANTPNPAADDNFGDIVPSKIKTPSNDDFSGSSNNQSGLAGTPTGGGKLGGRLAGNNPGAASDDSFGGIAPSKVKAPSNDDFSGSSNNQSGLAGTPTGGGKLGGRLAGNNPGAATGSDGDPSGIPQGNSWSGARADPSAGSKPAGNGDDDRSGGVFGLQCIKRCEISGLVDLEDRDGGKDKLRIAIAIDAKGNVTSASVAKSSGNSTIDRVVINGVKQMQFSPPGKVVRRVVKANILL